MVIKLSEEAHEVVNDVTPRRQLAQQVHLNTVKRHHFV